MGGTVDYDDEAEGRDAAKGIPPSRPKPPNDAHRWKGPPGSATETHNEQPPPGWEPKS
jgi:hypothetical protein